MSAALAAHGRLGGDPVQRQSASGTTWATASLAVSLGDDEGATQWFGLVAFGKVADLLTRHAKGDLLSVSGRLQLRTFDDRDGQSRQQLQVIADSIVSARTVRPGGGRKRGAGHA